MSLDDALTAWAGSVRLDDAAAAAIYQRITATPTPAARPGPAAMTGTGPDRDWWRDFTADFTARMIATTARPAPWAA
jgi:hypothetical protein